MECVGDKERSVGCSVGNCCAIQVRLEVVGAGMRAFPLEVGFLYWMLWKQF